MTSCHINTPDLRPLERVSIKWDHFLDKSSNKAEDVDPLSNSIKRRKDLVREPSSSAAVGVTSKQPSAVAVSQIHAAALISSGDT